MNSPIADYKELKVWQLAMDMTVAAYQLAARLPRDERFELASQIRRSAVSVPSNIAEGYGRWSRAEYLHSLSIANGSLKELETQSILTVRTGRLPAGSNSEVLGFCSRVGQMLTALRRSLT